MDWKRDFSIKHNRGDLFHTVLSSEAFVWRFVGCASIGLPMVKGYRSGNYPQSSTYFRSVTLFTLGDSLMHGAECRFNHEFFSKMYLEKTNGSGVGGLQNCIIK